MELNATTTRKLVAIHGWSGAALGILLYAIILTGTIAVFSEEIGHWSMGTVRQGAPLEVALAEGAPVQGYIDALAQRVDPTYTEDIGLGQSTTGLLQVFFHTHQTNDSGQVEEVGTQFEVDPDTGVVVSERHGTGAELFRGDQDRALSRFLVDVHTELHLPRPWGLLLTGILGLAMMVAAVSGFVMHRHLFKDIFTLRSRGQRALAIKDGHTVAGTWGLPFAFLLAFTGSFFSFAGSVGIPMMAMVGFGGDQEAMIEAIVSPGLPEDATPAEPALIDTILADAHERTGNVATFAAIEHYGRADSAISVFVRPDSESFARSTLLYSGASGEFFGVKPTIGQQPSIGSSVFDLVGPLHFGDFSGVLSKAIWLGLGFAMCYVTMTGMLLWIERREATEPGWRKFYTLLCVFGHGLPIALVGSAMAFFIAHGRFDTTLATPVGFLLICAVMSVFAMLTGRDQLKLRLFLGAGVALVLLPIVRMACGGPGWIEAIAAGQPMIVSIDILLLIAGAVYFDCYRKARKPQAISITAVPAG